MKDKEGEEEAAKAFKAAMDLPITANLKGQFVDLTVKTDESINKEYQ